MQMQLGVKWSIVDMSEGLEFRSCIILQERKEDRITKVHDYIEIEISGDSNYKRLKNIE